MQPNPSANGTPRLSSECLAVADSLHHLRTAFNQMIHDGNVTVMPEASTVLCEGLAVASALEALAEKLGVQQ